MTTTPPKGSKKADVLAESKQLRHRMHVRDRRTGANAATPPTLDTLSFTRLVARRTQITPLMALIDWPSWSGWKHESNKLYVTSVVSS